MQKQYSTFEEALAEGRKLVASNFDPDNDNWLHIIHSPNIENRLGDFWLEDSEGSFIIRKWESCPWTHDEQGEHFEDKSVKSFCNDPRLLRA